MPVMRFNGWGRFAPALLVSCLLCAPTIGCGAPASQIVKGERVNTGKRYYDQYFEEVIDLSEKIEALDSDLFPLRQPLTDILDVSVDSSLPDLLSATRDRAAKLKGYGVTANLNLNSNPTVLVERGALREDDKDEALFKAVQESATRGMITYKEYMQLLDSIAALDKQRDQLAGKLDQLGPKHPQRERIETELVGAGKVLAKAERKLLRDTRTVAHFLVGLADAVDTGALSLHDTRCEQAIAETDKKPSWQRGRGGRGARPTAGRGRGRGGGRGRGRGGGGKPTGGPRPAPKPTPKPAPAGGGDFEM